MSSSLHVKSDVKWFGDGPNSVDLYYMHYWFFVILFW